MESLLHILLSNALVATVMAAIAAALGRICRRPALTHCLWLVVMLKLVTPPLVPVSLPVANVRSPIGSSPAISSIDPDPRPAQQLELFANIYVDESTSRHSDELLSGAQADLAKPEPDLAEMANAWDAGDLSHKETDMALGLTAGWRWELPVLIVVLVGALGWWTLAAIRIIQFQRLMKDIRPAEGEWQFRTDRLAERVGLRRHPAVCLVPGRVPPMLWAIGGRPQLLVPSKLWIEMGDDARTSLLLHELAHLKRRDHWVRWLEIVVAGLYWWHPVAWWARRALREAEEQCCDAWVVWAMPDRARTYAAALLAAVEFVSGARTAPAVASATSGSGHVSCLKRRLKMIVRAKTPKGLSWAGRIAVLGMAALFLPLAPSWAQNNKLTPTEPDRLTGVGAPNGSTETQPSEPVRHRADQAVEDRVAEEFKKDPEAVALRSEIDKVGERLDHSRSANRDLTQNLDQQLVKIRTEIDAKRELLKDLYKKGKVAVLKPLEDRAQKMMAGMVQTDLALIEAQSMLDVKREAYKASQEESQQPRQAVDAQLRARIEEVFKKDADALALMQDIENTGEHLDRIKRNVRQPHDAARVAAQNHFDRLQQEYTDLWELKYQEILDRLTDPAGHKQSLARIQQARQGVDAQLLAQIQEVFKKDPKVLALMKEIEDTGEHLDRIKRNSPQPHDAARVAAQNHFDKLQQEYTDLWELKYPEILDRLTDPVGDKQSLARIRELEQKVEALKKVKDKQAELFKATQVEQSAPDDDTVQAAHLNFQINSLMNRQEQLKNHLAQLKFKASQEKDHVALGDPAQRAAEERLSKLKEQYENLWARKHDQLLAALTKDKDDDKKDEKTRDAAERLQEQLKDLIAKLGKELSPVAEEVRKALEQAVGEVHKSLEKDGLSAEELGKALERSQENLRKAFEGGGPVDKELREAIEKGRKDMEEAFDRARGDAQDQVESLRQRSRELRDQARENFDRARGEAERRLSRDGDEQPNRDELESARKEIRDLQQQLERATRRFGELQKREWRRNPVRRPEPNPQPEPQPQNPATPRAEPAPPEPPKEPAVPATPARPARPDARRPSAPIRPAPGVGRRGPQIENDRRLHELEDKMNQLLKELKNLKEEKSPKESK